MKYVLSNEEMRLADSRTITSGVPSLTLMERAGTALAKEAKKLAPTGKILCVCGGGNNGGDGFVCARVLLAEKREVDLLCVAEKFSPDCQTNRERWQGEVLSEIPQKEYALIVDCLFGTGFYRSLQGREGALVEQINALAQKGAKVLACDIPSGVQGGNGMVDGLAVRADCTLCIGEYKLGVFLGDGREYAGKVKRVDIGVKLQGTGYACLSTACLIKESLPTRKRNSHKGSYGWAAIVAGSEEYTGAAYLSAAACLRAGAGYTTLFVPKNLLSLYTLKAPEILLKVSSEGGRYAFNEETMQGLLSYTAVAYGMGMGISYEVYKGAKWLLEHYEGKLLLDADGLNSLAAFGGEELPFLWDMKKCAVVLTPHTKEFSRISGLSVEEILSDPVGYAKGYAKEHGVTLLLKNAVSVIADWENITLNTTGNTGLAKGGSGDVLAGILVSLMAQGNSGYDAARCAAYLLGKSAELATLDLGEYSLTASDVIAYMGKAFLFVTENTDEEGDCE